ncbi:DUF4307 domain-containing protein [Glaciihabitans arcticus]|uniref:DUF4307 domain-containing protein n=1 Tax=Glaciihabitans arcticus TaxID=2668039 RepID=A0A4V2JEZ0_9MICO|nr:DUF4307 domain-containing protein [Glaciihabitans arcticus]TBN57399.1 DUF4307 domain-containing protein [Glaciihabitans arcticus]
MTATGERADLDARYGRTRSSASRTRVISWSAAAAFVVVFVAWLVWGGLLGAPAQLEVRDTGHTVVDGALVDVSFALTVEPNSPVSCAVQALNDGFSVVGWKIIQLPPSEQRTRALETSVRTSELASTGLIYRCWLT